MAEEGPVVSAQRQVTLDGATLSIVCSKFANVVFILVTEIQKMGTVMSVVRECKGPDSPTTYSVRTLLGKDEPNFHVFGRAIAECVLSSPSSASSSSSSSLLLALGVRYPNPSTLPKLLPIIKELVP